MPKIKKGFTLIELLIVIAILGVLATAVFVAINPGTRSAQARDAIRKQDVSEITNALIGFYTLIGEYPTFETTCDTSRGRAGGGSSSDCSTAVSGSTWDKTWVATCPDTGSCSAIYYYLVTDQGFVKSLPKDPINNSMYYYQYEPSLMTQIPTVQEQVEIVVKIIG